MLPLIARARERGKGTAAWPVEFPDGLGPSVGTEDNLTPLPNFPTQPAQLSRQVRATQERHCDIEPWR